MQKLTNYINWDKINNFCNLNVFIVIKILLFAKVSKNVVKFREKFQNLLVDYNLYDLIFSAFCLLCKIFVYNIANPLQCWKTAVFLLQRRLSCFFNSEPKLLKCAGGFSWKLFSWFFCFKRCRLLDKNMMRMTVPVEMDPQR